MKPHILFMLRNIQHGRSASSLLERGLTFIQIAKLLSYAREERLIAYDENDNLVLTKEALGILYGSRRGIQKKSGVGWIDPKESERRSKNDKFEIYIPSRHVINGLLLD